jgi:hypothetical protein
LTVLTDGALDVANTTSEVIASLEEGFADAQYLRVGRETVLTKCVWTSLASKQEPRSGGFAKAHAAGMMWASPDVG